MICTDAELRGKSSFREWASLFSGKYHAMIVVYSDETGTGGIQKNKEPAPGLYGLIATPDFWEQFRDKWKAKLKEYDNVPYFHFRELNPLERKIHGATYFGWDNDRVDDFIYDMALLVGSGAIPFGGNVSQKETVGENPNRFQKAKLYRKIFYQFFGDFQYVMDDHFPNESEKVSFFFSDLNNEAWIKILSQIIKDARHRNPIIGEHAHIDPKCSSGRGIPCQAADLFAAVNRQNSSNMYEAGHVLRMRVLDLIIGRFVFPKTHPGSILRTIPEDEWRELVMDMRREKKKFEAENQKPGEPKPQFFPTLHHAGLRKLFGPYIK